MGIPYRRLMTPNAQEGFRKLEQSFDDVITQKLASLLNRKHQTKCTFHLKNLQLQYNGVKHNHTPNTTVNMLYEMFLNTCTLTTKITSKIVKITGLCHQY